MEHDEKGKHMSEDSIVYLGKRNSVREYVAPPVIILLLVHAH